MINCKLMTDPHTNMIKLEEEWDGGGILKVEILQNSDFSRAVPPVDWQELSITAI